MRTQIVFTPDGKVASLVHDWVFDEMYSAFATQGLAKPGELVKREMFAPLAKENAGGLAEIGYFTTLKLDGKAVDFAPVTDYWMEERPDHLVAFHVVLPLKTPQRVGRFGSLMVADPEYFIDFEFDDTDGVTFRSAPAGCSNSLRQAQAARRRRQEEARRVLLQRPRAGNQFRLQDGQPGDHRVPMKLRPLSSSRPLSSLRCLGRRRAGFRDRDAALRRRRRRGRRRRQRRRHGLAAERAVATDAPDVGPSDGAVARNSMAIWGLVGLGFAYGVFHAAGPGARQGGDRLLHDGQRPRAATRGRARLSRGADAGRGGGGARRRRRLRLQRDGGCR